MGMCVCVCVCVWYGGAPCQRREAPAAHRTFLLISLGVSVTMMVELTDEADILVWLPCSAGKKRECTRAGLRKPRRGATSRVMRK